MSFSGIYGGTERVVVGSEIVDGHAHEYWIEIKKCLTRQDEAEAQRALARVVIRAGDMVGDLDGAAYVEERVTRSVIAWNLTDDNGVDIPLTRDTILQLPAPVFEKVLARVVELNAPRTEQESATFPESNGRSHSGQRRKAAAGVATVLDGSGDVAEVRGPIIAGDN